MNNRNYPTVISRRESLKILAMQSVGACLGFGELRMPSFTDEVTYSNIPRWRGFNLLEKYQRDHPGWNRAYYEKDLDIIAGWGFDFVRLPTDYRIWTRPSGTFDERPLRDIDQVIEWARARGIHVSLCLHRSPGYCVNPPAERLNLFGQGPGAEEARRQFAAQWKMFSGRYAGIPSRSLSFNLLNEPPDISGIRYARAIEPAVRAIRGEDPNRLIFADGVNYGKRPVPELVPLRLAQSTRGYEPGFISHYRASWVKGSDKWPVPRWPIVSCLNRYLYGDAKSDLKSPLVLEGNFDAGSTLSIEVERVSARAELVIKADGSTIFSKFFEPKPGRGEWTDLEYQPEWKLYQGVYNKTYSVRLPRNAKRLAIEIQKGDWLTFSKVVLEYPSGDDFRRQVLNTVDQKWGVRQDVYILNDEGQLIPASEKYYCNANTLWSEQVSPWVEFRRRNHVGIHVGEWGAHNQTPHPVVLAWMKDCLANWHRGEMGWALWNLRGSFGVLDSDRKDVAYENFRGHKLDRKMLEILTEDGI